MSKKQIMKNIEKNSKNNIKKGEKDSFFKFITTLMVMILIFILVYFLIGVFYTKEIDLNDDKSIIPSWLSIFESKNSNATIYKVDSKNKFNSEFLTNENGNKNATTYSDLKVKSPTLIKINNKSISEYIEGEDNIKEYFKNN